jgi:Na+/H+ antiporter NhaA
MTNLRTHQDPVVTPMQRRSLAVQLSAPVRRFLSTEAGSAGLLLAATVVALVWANSAWSATYEGLWAAEAGVSVAGWELSMDLGHWVNDGAMALFFFVIGLEVRREFSVGELTTPRRAAIPVIAAVGGMVVPALLYLALAPAGEAANAWGLVIGTDTAFLLGALAVVGPALATKLRIFLLTLTVIDDIVAVSVIGLVYSDALDPAALAVMAMLGGLMGLMSRYGVSTATPYLLVGLGLWLATLQAGLHASIAGMFGGLLVAAHEPRRDAIERAVRRFGAFRKAPGVEAGRSAHRELVRAVSVNERLQLRLHPAASYVIVPVFAFANAGIDLRNGVLLDALSARLTWAVVVGLVVGKLLGIGLASWAGVRVGAGRLPTGVGFGQVLGGAALSGIGFTVSLLIAGLAFTDRALHDQAVVGVLIAAVLSTLLGWAVFRGADTSAVQIHPDRPGAEPDQREGAHEQQARHPGTQDGPGVKAADRERRTRRPWRTRSYRGARQRTNIAGPARGVGTRVVPGQRPTSQLVATGRAAARSSRGSSGLRHHRPDHLHAPIKPVALHAPAADELAEVGADHQAHDAVGVEPRTQQPGAGVLADSLDQSVGVRSQGRTEQLGELGVGVSHDRSEAPRS